MNLFFFLVTACAWGGSFVAIKPLVEIVPPVLAGALRIAVGLAFLTAALPVLHVPYGIPRALRVRVWGTGVVAFGIPFAFLFWGEKSISPGLAGIINGTVPIWVFVLGLLFTPKAEPFSVRKIVGLLLGISGVVAIFLPKVLAAGSDPSLLGTLAVIAMAISYGTSVLMNRSTFMKHPELSPFTNLYQQLIAGFLVLAVLSLVTEGIPNPAEWHPLSTVVWTELYLGCISTSLAFMLFYRLIRAWGSVRAATVTYVIPAITLAFDFALNGNVPGRNEILGVLGVTAGVIILNLPGRKKAL